MCNDNKGSACHFLSKVLKSILSYCAVVLLVKIINARIGFCFLGVRNETFDRDGSCSLF